MPLRARCCVFVAIFTPVVAFSQTISAGSPTAIVRDPQALSLVNQALQATSGGTIALNDVTLQGTVNYTAGSDFQSGTVVLEARGNGMSRVTLSLDGGQRQEVRNGPAGYWVDAEGQQHLMAVHNCWPDAPWFFPALSLQALSSDAQVSIVYGGLEARDGVQLYHLRLYRTVPGQDVQITSDIQRLSIVDLYLDPASYMPLILAFKAHPDDDLNIDIPVEIQFGDYRQVNGVRVPFHIQKSLQGNLLLDIRVSGAVLNSGLPESDFAVPTAGGGAL